MCPPTKTIFSTNPGSVLAAWSCLLLLFCTLQRHGLIFGTGMAVKSPPWVTVFRNPRKPTEVTFPSEVDKSNAKSRQVFWMRFF